jgi:hypothetical protein
MNTEWIPIATSAGSLLVAIAAVLKVWVDRRGGKETAAVSHSEVLMSGFGGLVDQLQEQVNVLDATVQRQGAEIQELKMKYRDAEDNVRLLTLDRDDLIALAHRNDLSLPFLRTVGYSL